MVNRGASSRPQVQRLRSENGHSVSMFVLVDPSISLRALQKLEWEFELENWPESPYGTSIDLLTRRRLNFLRLSTHLSTPMFKRVHFFTRQVWLEDFIGQCNSHAAKVCAPSIRIPTSLIAPGECRLDAESHLAPARSRNFLLSRSYAPSSFYNCSTTASRSFWYCLRLSYLVRGSPRPFSSTGTASGVTTPLAGLSDFYGWSTAS